ncbi:MAG: DUF3667 domain-containing protein [Sphingobacteriaceae bacterium]|nr:MAG: DUF3667 domain-containing protein [Sphingobacteriaceae bacterium]
MHHANQCLNCAHHLETEDKFCPECGQAAKTHPRITMHHISHEVVHAVAHADKGFFHLIRALATQPGTTIKEYLSGKHKKYFSPFSFFFIVLGIYVLSNSILRPFDSVTTTSTTYTKDGKTYTQKYPSKKQQEKFNKISARVATAMNFMNTRTNIVLCISTPFIALIMFLLYRRKLFYAEQLVIMTFVNGFLNLLSIFIFTPLMYFAKGTHFYMVLVMAMMLTHLVYIAIVYHSILNLSATIKGYIQATLTALAGLIGWIILSFTLIFLYIMWGVLF